MCGSGVTRQVREFEAREGRARLLVIGCTGHAGVLDHDAAAAAAGQDHIFGKPLPKDFGEQVVKLLRA